MLSSNSKVECSQDRSFFLIGETKSIDTLVYYELLVVKGLLLCSDGNLDVLQSTKDSMGSGFVYDSPLPIPNFGIYISDNRATYTTCEYETIVLSNIYMSNRRDT